MEISNTKEGDFYRWDSFIFRTYWRESGFGCYFVLSILFKLFLSLRRGETFISLPLLHIVETNTWFISISFAIPLIDIKITFPIFWWPK